MGDRRAVRVGPLAICDAIESTAVWLGDVEPLHEVNHHGDGRVALDHGAARDGCVVVLRDALERRLEPKVLVLEAWVSSCAMIGRCIRLPSQEASTKRSLKGSNSPPPGR